MTTLAANFPFPTHTHRTPFVLLYLGSRISSSGKIREGSFYSRKVGQLCHLSIALGTFSSYRSTKIDVVFISSGDKIFPKH